MLIDGQLIFDHVVCVEQKKRILDDEDTFCSLETLKQVLACKSIFDNLDDREMRNARFRSNPYEAIGSRFFQNRYKRMHRHLTNFCLSNQTLATFWISNKHKSCDEDGQPGRRVRLYVHRAEV